MGALQTEFAFRAEQRAAAKAEHGCRPDQLFGAWSIEPTRFQAMAEQAKHADLAALRAARAKGTVGPGMALSEAQKGPGYLVSGKGIATIELNGPMTKYPTSFQEMFGGTSTLRTREALRAAVRDPGVRGILLKIDSPGGTVAGTADLADAVRAADSKKPVFAYAEDLCCSAAYWAASGARRVYANSTGTVGSIGTFAVVQDTSGMYEQAGVKVHVVSSAPFKGAGTDGAPVTEEHLAEFQRHIVELNDLFVNAVAKGRHMPIARARELADGRVHVGSNAQAAGLVDAIAPLETAMRDLEKQAMTEEKILAEAAELEVKNEALTAKVAELEAALAAKEEKAADPLAGMSPEARERIEALEKANAAQVAETAALREQLELAKYTDQASAFKALPIKVEVFAPILMACATGKPLTTEQNAELTRVLKAADHQAVEAGVLKEHGTSAAGDAKSPIEQLNALAAAKVTAGEYPTQAQAFSAACRERADLYKLHREGQRKGAN